MGGRLTQKLPKNGVFISFTCTEKKVKGIPIVPFLNRHHNRKENIMNIFTPDVLCYRASSRKLV